ncbi:MAG: glycosyltransferase family 4 protein [Acidimicrobiia bacterium]
MSPVILLTNIPNHYRIPLFNELKRQLADAGKLLVVLFAAESYERRRSMGRETRLEDAAFEWHILPSLTLGRYRPIFFPRGLGTVVDRYRPSAFIVLGTGSLALAASRAARRGRIPLIVWSGEIGRGSRVAARLKRPLKRYLLRRTSALVSYGTASADFLRELVPDKAIYEAWNTCDLSPFLSVERQVKAREGDPLRMVTVGDLEEVKGYSFLLRAMAKLDPELIDTIELVVVGDGSLKDELCSLAETLGLADRVRFSGRRPATEIPSVLAGSDLFVFPSLGDVWGLALLEAMAAGLPVIASSRAGATRDLVIPGTGLVIDPVDVKSFSHALASMVGMSAQDRVEMGIRARAHVSRLCSLENSAAGFVAAIRHALGSSPLT